MVVTLGNDIIKAYTGGVEVKEIYSNGVKVWPVTTPVPVPPNTQIWCTTNTGQACTPMYTTRFGATLLTNTYADGLGVMTFDGNVTRVGDLVFENNQELLTMYLPDTVTTIGEYAYENCENLHTIRIPSGVTAIGQNAFDIPLDASHRGRLRSFTIPSGVTRIENKTFYNQGTLPSITIPSRVTYIGVSAFERCVGLTTITIPASVTAIDDRVFYDCTNLIEVIMESTVPPTISSMPDCFDTGNPETQIKVPAEAYETYRRAPGWSNIYEMLVPMS